MPKVKFIKDGKEVKEVECEAGAVLRRVAMANQVPIHHDMVSITTAIVQYVNCKGMGMCGTCSVHIKKGMENASPKSMMERLKFSYSLLPIGHEDVIRLSCQTKVNGDMEVEVQPPFNLGGERFWEVK